MTVRERKYIEARIAQFESWCKKEEAESRRSDDQEEKDEHHYQARLHDCAANTLWNLLNDLESKNYRV